MAGERRIFQTGVIRRFRSKRDRNRRGLLALLAFSTVLSGCTAQQGLERTRHSGNLVSAFQSTAPAARPLAVTFDADPALASGSHYAQTAPGAFYRSYRIEVSGDRLAAGDAAALAALGAGAGQLPVRAVLLSVRPSVEGRRFPELPVALLGIDRSGDAQVFARWSYQLPPARDDLRISVDWLARTTPDDLAEGRRAADLAARLSGMTASAGSEGPRWLAAPLSDGSVAALAEATDGALSEAFSRAAAFTPSSAPARVTPRLSMKLGRLSENSGDQTRESGMAVKFQQEIARSRLEPARDQSAFAFEPSSPGLGFQAPSGARLLDTARYLRLQDPDGANPALGSLLAQGSDGADGSQFTDLVRRTAPVADADIDRHCSAMTQYFRTNAALTRIDRVAAMVETLRLGGREAALFKSTACLPAEDRPVACATGLLNCGEARPSVDERVAMKALTDYMRWPTRARRDALTGLLPDRISVSNINLASGGGAGDSGAIRGRLSRETLLDTLAEARLNRYGEAARNPNDPEWWMANFTRRPALRRVLTVYAAFENGLFDDIGFVEARVDDTALADPRSWARAQLGPLITPCNRTESPTFGAGLVMSARQPLGDCARFDDFAL